MRGWVGRGLCVALGLGAGAAWGRKPGVFGEGAVVEAGASALKYGAPEPRGLQVRGGYVLSYDARSRGARWVLERLRAEELRGPARRRACAFRPDPDLHPYHRATDLDYRHSGFQRGHLAAAANHSRSQARMDDTFLLSNVAPQVPHLNQHAWNNLEKYCRSLTSIYKNVYVCTGPLFLPRQEADGKMYVKYQVIGKNHVAVPTHFFKVLILEAEGGLVELRSYVMPNAPVDETIPLDRFLVPIESIERASGLLFVPNILKRTNKLRAITPGDK
ncbi:endonuclease G, mitochondrial [Ornithorhynchus anatinus]|uniref:Endonuclease G, mitochondrial n=1 Tax=Ornithorhynchus anatinus TaxID=9258 RepID=A0A6I8NEA2_ORNAN|nr:endonuclease G, mitochondrial [Ornithorhynchus anatinus]